MIALTSFQISNLHSLCAISREAVRRERTTDKLWIFARREAKNFLAWILIQALRFMGAIKETLAFLPHENENTFFASFSLYACVKMNFSCNFVNSSFNLKTDIILFLFQFK